MILPVLAGCIGAPGQSQSPASIDPRDLVEQAYDKLHGDLLADHDHTDPLLHDRSANVDLVGYSSLIGEARDPGAYTDIDVHGNYTLVEVKRPEAGFVIADTSNPKNPEVVSWFRAGEMYAPDSKWGPDGNWVFTGSHDQSYAGTGGVDTDAIRAADDHKAPIPLGISVFDASNKQDPVWHSYLQCGTSGVHNVNVAEIAGEIYVFGACYDSYVNRVVVARLNVLEGRGVLERVGEITVGEYTDYVQGQPGSVHDMVVNEDPKDGDPVLTISYGSQGVVWVDVSNPEDPTFRGQWRWEGDDHVSQSDHRNFLHYAELAETTYHGKRITIAAPEYRSHPHTGYTWIVDTTNYDAPTLLGKWQIADDVAFETEGGDPGSMYRYSPHNFKIDDGTFYIAHNHAGIWAVDFASTEERLEDPQTTGFYATAKDPGHHLPIDNGPDFWGLDVQDGKLYAADRGTGLYVLDPPGDADGMDHADHEH